MCGPSPSAAHRHCRLRWQHRRSIAVPIGCLWPGPLGVDVVADMLHPVHGLAVETFLDGDVAHGGGGSSAMPVFLSRCEPHDVARMDCLDGTDLALHEA